MHKHAKIIMEWAKMIQLPESEWRVMQFKSEYKDWSPCRKAPYFYDYHEYRWAPRTIRIGDYDVPEPERTALKRSAYYFIPCADIGDRFMGSQWTDHDADLFRLENGLIHLNKESAALHAKALLSLTQKKE